MDTDSITSSSHFCKNKAIRCEIPKLKYSPNMHGYDKNLSLFSGMFLLLSDFGYFSVKRVKDKMGMQNVAYGSTILKFVF